MAGLGGRSTAGRVAFWLSKYSWARDALAKRFWNDSRSSVKWVFMPVAGNSAAALRGRLRGQPILRLSRTRSQDCTSQPVILFCEVNKYARYMHPDIAGIPGPQQNQVPEVREIAGG